MAMNLYYKFTSFANHYLPRKYFLKLRTAYFYALEKINPIRRQMYGSFDSSQLKSHLENELTEDFEILMVHSSYNSLKTMYLDSANDFVRMLVEFCGHDRTLVMPAFYFGDEKYSNVRETFSENPRFDLKRTPSQMGLATEIFRRWKGVKQSRHPIYRISALGPLDEELTQGHEFADGPAGAGSPFEFMANRKTLIIGIGKSYDVMTQTHHVEAIMGDRYPIPRVRGKDLQVVLIDEKKETPLDLPSYQMLGHFNISKLPGILKNGEMKVWKFHSIPFFSAEASVITESLINAAENGRTLYDSY